MRTTASQLRDLEISIDHRNRRERHLGDSRKKILEELEDPVSRPTKENRFKPQQEKIGTQLAAKLYAGFALLGQPSHLYQLPISSCTPWLYEEWW